MASWFARAASVVQSGVAAVAALLRDDGGDEAGRGDDMPPRQQLEEAWAAAQREHELLVRDAAVEDANVLKSSSVPAHLDAMVAAIVREARLLATAQVERDARSSATTTTSGGAAAAGAGSGGMGMGAEVTRLAFREGECIEYLLEYRVIDKLVAMAIADRPKGMMPLVLLALKEVIGVKPETLLPSEAVHRALRQLIAVCIASRRDAMTGVAASTLASPADGASFGAFRSGASGVGKSAEPSPALPGAVVRSGSASAARAAAAALADGLAPAGHAGFATAAPGGGGGVALHASALHTTTATGPFAAGGQHGDRSRQPRTGASASEAATPCVSDGEKDGAAVDELAAAAAVRRAGGASAGADAAAHFDAGARRVSVSSDLDGDGGDDDGDGAAPAAAANGRVRATSSSAAAVRAMSAPRAVAAGRHSGGAPGSLPRPSSRSRMAALAGGSELHGRGVTPPSTRRRGDGFAMLHGGDGEGDGGRAIVPDGSGLRSSSVAARLRSALAEAEVDATSGSAAVPTGGDGAAAADNVATALLGGASLRSTTYRKVPTAQRLLAQLCHTIWCAIARTPSLLSCFYAERVLGTRRIVELHVLDAVAPWIHAAGGKGTKPSFSDVSRDAVALAFSLRDQRVIGYVLRKTGIVQHLALRAAEAFARYLELCLLAQRARKLGLVTAAAGASSVAGAAAGSAPAAPSEVPAELTDPAAMQAALRLAVDRLDYINTLVLVSGRVPPHPADAAAAPSRGRATAAAAAAAAASVTSPAAAVTPIAFASPLTPTSEAVATAAAADGAALPTALRAAVRRYSLSSPVLAEDAQAVALMHEVARVVCDLVMVEALLSTDGAQSTLAMTCIATVLRQLHQRAPPGSPPLPQGLPIAQLIACALVGLVPAAVPFDRSLPAPESFYSDAVAELLVKRCSVRPRAPAAPAAASAAGAAPAASAAAGATSLAVQASATTVAALDLVATIVAQPGNVLVEHAFAPYAAATLCADGTVAAGDGALAAAGLVRVSAEAVAAGAPRAMEPTAGRVIPRYLRHCYEGIPRGVAASEVMRARLWRVQPLAAHDLRMRLVRAAVRGVEAGARLQSKYGGPERLIGAGSGAVVAAAAAGAASSGSSPGKVPRFATFIEWATAATVAATRRDAEIRGTAAEVGGSGGEATRERRTPSAAADGGEGSGGASPSTLWVGVDMATPAPADGVYGREAAWGVAMHALTPLDGEGVGRCDLYDDDEGEGEGLLAAPGDAAVVADAAAYVTGAAVAPPERAATPAPPAAGRSTAPSPAAGARKVAAARGRRASFGDDGAADATAAAPSPAASVRASPAASEAPSPSPPPPRAAPLRVDVDVGSAGEIVGADDDGPIALSAIRAEEAVHMRGLGRGLFHALLQHVASVLNASSDRAALVAASGVLSQLARSTDAWAHSLVFAVRDAAPGAPPAEPVTLVEVVLVLWQDVHRRLASWSDGLGPCTEALARVRAELGMAPPVSRPAPAAGTLAHAWWSEKRPLLEAFAVLQELVRELVATLQVKGEMDVRLQGW